MSSEPPPPGLTAAVNDLGRRLITALPPAFLMLALMNLAFIGLVLWFLDQQMEHRFALANRILDGCLLSGGKVD